MWFKGTLLALGKGQSRKHEQSWHSVIIESWMCSQLHSVTPASIALFRSQLCSYLHWRIKALHFCSSLFIIFCSFFARATVFSHHAWFRFWSLLCRFCRDLIVENNHQSSAVGEAIWSAFDKFVHLITNWKRNLPQEVPLSFKKKSIKHYFSPPESRGHLRRTGCICFFSGLHKFFWLHVRLHYQSVWQVTNHRLEVLLNSKILGW